MSTPTKSPVAASAGSPSQGDRSQSPSRIRNLVERSSTFINNRKASFRRKKQDHVGGGDDGGRPRSPGASGNVGNEQQGVVGRTVSKTVAALKWTPLPSTNIIGYLPLIVLVALIGLSCVGLWTILSATVLRDW